MNIVNVILDFKPLTILIVIVTFLFGIHDGFFKNLNEKFRLVQMAWRIYAIALTTLSLIFVGFLFLDQIILSFIHSLNNSYGNSIHALGSYVSMNTRFWLLLSFSFLICYALGIRHISRVLFGAILSAAVAGLGSQSFKFMMARARPYTDEGPFSFFNYANIRQHAYQSLPSGDVVIVSGASAYFFYSTKNRILKFIILFLPVCAVYYRINENKHWPSDTFFSTGIGFLSAAMIWKMANYAPKAEPTKFSA